MKSIKPIFKKIIYICLALGFIIITALSLLIHFGSKPIDYNKPIILISVDETIGLSDEDIISKLFIMRLQQFPSLQDCKITNVKKCNNLNNKIRFAVRFLIKPETNSYNYWAVGGNTDYEDNWIERMEEVELIKEDNQYRIEIIRP